MKKLQIFILIFSVLFLFPFLSHSGSCDGFRDPAVLNLLPYNIGLRSDYSSQSKIIQIERGQRKSCLGKYKNFYVERYFYGSDPWEFNLCDVQVDDEESILFVLTKEGLFVLKIMDIQNDSNPDMDIVKNRSIKRLLPLD